MSQSRNTFVYKNLTNRSFNGPFKSKRRDGGSKEEIVIDDAVLSGVPKL